MRDLTQGSISFHLISMSLFIGGGLFIQILYLLVDLYFVARLGNHELAGVSAAGAAWMLGSAGAQVLAIGTLSLAARSIGARKLYEAQTATNQALGLSGLVGAAVLAGGYAAGPATMKALAADPAVAAAGLAYLRAVLPGLAMMFPVAVLVSALRASGVVAIPTAVQALTVLLNAGLAAGLILGWGPFPALGPAGAGLATSLSIAVGLAASMLLFSRLQSGLRFSRAALRPQLAVWRRIAAAGLPAGGELVTMFLLTSLTYVLVRDYGPTAQAGYGVGLRVLQAVLLPAVALGLAVAPVAAQNFGAGEAARVRATFRQGVLLAVATMLGPIVLCQLAPTWLTRPFAADHVTATIAADYLRVLTWSAVPVGIVLAASGMFQAFGDTRPALASGLVRLGVFGLVTLALQTWPAAPLTAFWVAHAIAVLCQAFAALALLRREAGLRLASGAADVRAQPV